MKKIIIAILLLLNACCIIRKSETEAENPGITATETALVIKNTRECINIDSLKGIVVLYIFVTNEPKIEYFNIVHLELQKSSGDEILKYHKMVFNPTTIRNYPKEIRPYYSIFKDYIATLTLEKKSGMSIDPENRLYLRIKIGCK